MNSKLDVTLNQPPSDSISMHEALAMTGSDEQWWPLIAVILVHVALLGGMMLGLDDVKSRVVPPVVTGVLVAAPKIEPPKPLPVEPKPPPPKPKPVVQPKPEPPPPMPEAPPSETAIAVPEEPPPPEEPVVEESMPVIAEAPPMIEPEPLPEPVIPPRVDASHLNNPAPVYPAICRRLGEQGRVLFDVYILADGTVGEIKLKQSSGYPRLDESAYRAVRNWRYVPAHRGSEPIPYWYVQPITFTLNR
jgi:protein TonB